MGARRMSSGSEKVDRGQGRGWRLTRARGLERAGSPEMRTGVSERAAGGSEGFRAGLARTQEVLGHARWRHLLPQIQRREKVELLLRDYGRASRFCGSPRAPLGPCARQVHSSPRTRPQVPQPRSGAAPTGTGPTASPP